jgi:hypothetical protein
MKWMKMHPGRRSAAQPRPLAKPSHQNSGQAAPSRDPYRTSTLASMAEDTSSPSSLRVRVIWAGPRRKVFPLLHLGNPPAPGKGAREARRAAAHSTAPLSSSSELPRVIEDDLERAPILAVFLGAWSLMFRI